MGALMREIDWSQTPLGPLATWPSSLRTTISLCLASNSPISIAWGPSCIQIYNDGYWPVCGKKHPSSMGQDFRECWASAWPVVGSVFERAQQGQTSYLENQRMFLDRNGYLEETFFTFSFSPIRGATGAVEGVFHPVTELTQQTLAERRLQLIRELTGTVVEAATVEAAIARLAATLAQHALDLPFFLFYRYEVDSRQARLVEQAGFSGQTPANPALIEVDGGDSLWNLAATASQRPYLVNGLDAALAGLTCGPYPEVPKQAWVLPIVLPGMGVPLGWLVVGVSARRVLDAPYQQFYEMLHDTVVNVVAKARAYEVERQRAEALAAIDQAKTAFFSNVSHEFRTPLTLMLAPLEDALQSLGAEAEAAPAAFPLLREQLAVAYRNAQRLLRLVNTLLDFSRIEAGRIQARYEPTALAQFTADLASSFRSLVERAGLDLVVDCQPLPMPVYVDRAMWEKIVFNLLSNAFKFTFEGTITVGLYGEGTCMVLTVADTGTGIPAHELPHLFKRFHRVEGAQGRSFEGSGIGLSLVQELVKLHGGDIQVTSQPEVGTCFTITIPTGTAHLPAERLYQTGEVATAGTGADLYLQEAAQWLHNGADSPLAANDWNSVPSRTHSLVPAADLAVAEPLAARATVLVVDDNSDLRHYITRLLSPFYQVQTAQDGRQALAQIQAQVPDLVLSDVMMPQIDGFELLQQLRSHPTTEQLPIILLSARAGEGARLEGLEAGADDYLVKPFSARELLGRVEATLKLAQLRQTAAERERTLRQAAETSQAETQRTAERLIQLLESMSDGFIELNRDWQILYQNAAAERLSGKARTTVLGKTYWQVWPSTLGTDLEAQLQKAMQVSQPIRFEYCSPDPSRPVQWLDVRAYPTDEGLSVFFGDISDRKQAQQALEQWVAERTSALRQANADLEAANHQLAQEVTERRVLQQAVEAREALLASFFEAASYAGIGLCIVDEQWRYRQINQALADINGVPVSDHLGKTIAEVVPNLAAPVIAILEEVKQTGQAISREVVGETPKLPGVERYWLASYFPIKDSNLTTAFGIVAIEISDRKRIEQTLQNVNQELSRSNQELQDFAYVASHDLQEPLRKIQAFGDRLQTKYGHLLGETGQDYLNRMSNASQRMQTLIQDLLTFSRVTTKAQPFVPVDLNAVIANVCSDLETRIEQTQGHIEVDPLATIEADPVQMRQLLQNLIGNALKFHRPGGAPSYSGESAL